MSAKPKTIAAAERRQIRAELKQLDAVKRKISKDFSDELKRLTAARDKAQRDLNTFNARREKQLPRLTASANRRIDLLKGRLGL